MRRQGKRSAVSPELHPAVVGTMTKEMIRSLLSHGTKNTDNIGILLVMSGADPKKARLILARHEEAAGRLGIAGDWYQIIARDYEDSEPFRQFLVRHGELKGLLKRFRRAVTPEELCAVGRYRLRHKSSGSEDHLQTALEAFQRARFSEGVAAVLRQAIHEANVAAAKRAARYFDRRLSEREIYRLAKAMIRRDPDSEKTVTFVTANGLERKLGRKLLDAILRKRKEPYYLGYLDQKAKQLGEKLTREDLEYLFSQADPNHLGYTQRLAIAERLATGSPRWRRRIPALVLEARQQSFASGYAKSAERYGKQCGRPLTAEELIAYLDRWRDDDRYKVEVVFAIDLAVKRILERVKPKPVKTQAAA